MLFRSVGLSIYVYRCLIFQVIETRIGNLEKNLEGENKDKNQKELDDLKMLLPDVIAKVCIVTL